MQHVRIRVLLFVLAVSSAVALGGCDGSLHFGCDASLMGDQPPSLESAAEA